MWVEKGNVDFRRSLPTFFHRYPLAMDSLSAAILGALGNIVSQGSNP